MAMKSRQHSAIQRFDATGLRVAGRVRHCKAGRHWQPVQAFVGTLQKAVVCLPSPFLPERAKSCPLNLLDQTAYHPSCFSNDLFTAGAVQGPSAFDVAMKRWSTTYLQQRVHSHIVAIDGMQRDAFVYFAVDLLSTGQQLEQRPSRVAGLYRLHLNEAGAVSDVWLHRSGTAEERRHLVREEATPASTHTTPPLRLAWAPATEQPLPCTWLVDEEYRRQCREAADSWAHDVCSKASMQAMLRLARPDISVCPGTCLQADLQPLQGVASVGAWLLAQSLDYELSPRLPLSVVSEPGGNKVFTHWVQQVVCRKTGATSTMDGASMFVFDAAGRIAQVFCFGPPVEHVRSQLLCPHASAQHSSSSSSSSSSGISSSNRGRSLVEDGMPPRQQHGSGPVRLMTQEEVELQECLARQEREWQAW